jgi:hypothetical protein
LASLKQGKAITRKPWRFRHIVQERKVTKEMDSKYRPDLRHIRTTYIEKS